MKILRLVLIVLVFLVGGAIWGLFIPQIRGTITDGYVDFDPTTDGAQFTGYVYFVLATGLLGFLSALVMWARAPRSRGVGMLFGVTIASVLGSIVFAHCGNWVAGLIHPVPHSSIRNGANVSWAPIVSPGIAYVVAPFMASLTYWCAAVIGKGDFPDED